MTDPNLTAEMFSNVNIISIIGMLLMIAAWAFAVFRENSDQVLERVPYVLMCIGAFIFLVIVGAGSVFTGLSIEVISIINTAAQITVSYIMGGKSTLRARDAGWPKAWVFCMIIPIIGFIIMLVLWFKGPATSSDAINQEGGM